MQSTQPQTSTRKSHNSNVKLTMQRKLTKEDINIAGRQLRINIHILDMLFKWMVERDRIQKKRQAGMPAPWSEDAVLREHKFCNVYRAFDRGTQYILREVINKGDQTHLEICFRVMLYKLFNRSTTWELIQKKLGPVSWLNFNLEKYGRVLLATMNIAPIYTSAYQIPAPNLGYSTAVMNHLRLLQIMMEENLPDEILKRQSMRDAYNLIIQYPGMGPFLSFQLLLDLNMSPYLNFDENKWAACGPGSRKCLRMIFGCNVGGIESKAIEYLYNTQNEHFARLGITDLPRIAEDEPGVSFVDLEHSLCECYKYSKLRDVKGKWTASSEPLSNVLPSRRFEAVSTTRTHSEGSVLSFRDLSLLMDISTDLPLSLTELTPKPIRIKRQDDTPEYDDTDYEVSHITHQRYGPRGLEYKVRWVGYGPEDDWWLLNSELKNAPEVLRQWRISRQKNSKPRNKAKKSSSMKLEKKSSNVQIRKRRKKTTILDICREKNHIKRAYLIKNL